MCMRPDSTDVPIVLSRLLACELLTVRSFWISLHKDHRTSRLLKSRKVVFPIDITLVSMVFLIVVRIIIDRLAVALTVAFVLLGIVLV